jgi:hypothetical protein
MFPTYFIYDPNSEKSVKICKLSYVVGGLFGVLYFVIKAGHIRLLEAVGLTLACLLAIALLVLATSLLSAEMQMVAILVLVPAILTFQAVKTVALVKSSYRRRAWIVQQDD